MLLKPDRSVALDTGDCVDTKLVLGWWPGGHERAIKGVTANREYEMGDKMVAELRGSGGQLCHQPGGRPSQQPAPHTYTPQSLACLMSHFTHLILSYWDNEDHVKLVDNGFGISNEESFIPPYSGLQ